MNIQQLGKDYVEMTSALDLACMPKKDKAPDVIIKINVHLRIEVTSIFIIWLRKKIGNIAAKFVDGCIEGLLTIQAIRTDYP